MITKLVKTTLGYYGRILASDIKHPTEPIALAIEVNGREWVYAATSAGVFGNDKIKSQVTRYSLWVNIVLYPGEDEPTLIQFSAESVARQATYGEFVKVLERALPIVKEIETAF